MTPGEKVVLSELFPLQSNWFDVTRDGRFLVPEYQLNPDAPGLNVAVGWSGSR